MKSSEFLRHTFVYAAGNLLLQALSFLLLPIYARALTPAEFGRLEILTRIGEFVAICLMMNGLRQTVVLQYGGADEAKRRAGVAGAATLSVLCLSALGLAGVCVAWLAGGWSWLADSSDFVVLAVLVALLEASAWTLLGLAQARFQSLAYVAFALGWLALRIGLTCVLVLTFDHGLAGVLVASLVSTGLALVAILRWEWRHLALDGSVLRSFLASAACFVPAGIGAFILNYGDRFLLLRWVDEREIGLYALGYKLALCVTLLSRTPVAMVWGPLLQHYGRRPDHGAGFGKVLTRSIGAYLFLGLGVAILGREVVLLVAGARYLEAYNFALPILVAYLFVTAAETLESVLYAHGRTSLKAITSTISTIAGVVLYVVFIPRFGGSGAALATTLAYLLHLIVTWLAVRRVAPVRLEIGRLMVLVGSAASVWAVAQMFAEGPLGSLLKIALWSAWVAVLWCAGVVSAEEKTALTTAWRRAVAAARSSWMVAFRSGTESRRVAQLSGRAESWSAR